MSRNFVADAHRGDGKCFVVRADEKLTAFVELERAIYESMLITTSVAYQLETATIFLVAESRKRIEECRIVNANHSHHGATIPLARSFYSRAMRKKISQRIQASLIYVLR